MQLNRRKIKYAAVFFFCWLAVLVIVVDVVVTFQTMVDWVGSYALVEGALLLLLVLPAWAVYKFTRE